VFTPTTTMAASGDLSKVAGAIKHFAEKHPGITAGVGAVGGAGALAVGGTALLAHSLDCLVKDMQPDVKDCIF